MGSIDWLFVYLLTRFALPEYDFEKARQLSHLDGNELLID